MRFGTASYPEHVLERNFLTPRGEFRVDAAATQKTFSSLLYKLSYLDFDKVTVLHGKPNTRHAPPTRRAPLPPHPSRAAGASQTARAPCEPARQGGALVPPPVARVAVMRGDAVCRAGRLNGPGAKERTDA